MKTLCKTILLALLGLQGLAQESAPPRVAIPLIANPSHRQSTTVTVESLVITDQKTPISNATLLAGKDLPLELGILLDASGSQGDAHRNDKILKATKQFVDATIRGPKDRVFFLKFDAAAQMTGWMTKEQLQGTVIEVRVGGGTALYDAVAAACEKRMGPREWQKPTRRVLLIISDGEDNLSHITSDAAALEALKSGAVIFTIDTELSGMAYRGTKNLEIFAKLTGGKSFNQVDGKDISKTLANIQELINGMYYISYAPPDASKGAVHEVEVKSTAKKKLELTYAKMYVWNP